MALKYQALNGTVISKTITIEGMNIEKAGTPAILRGIKTEEGYIMPFMGWQGTNTPTYGGSSTLSTIAGSVYSLYSSLCQTITISGVNYTGSTGAIMLFSNHNSTTNNTNTSYHINGYFTIIKASESAGITTIRYDVNNKQFTSSGDSSAWLKLVIEKNSSEVILSVTFTPTPTE